jgi:hypothetical protein
MHTSSWDGKKKRCEHASPRFDLSRGNGLEDLLHVSGSVPANEPAPMCKAPVVNELYDDGLFVFGTVKLLKPVRPKEGPEASRQVRV